MSIEKTLSERGARYGDFADHARLCQSLKRVMQSFSIKQGVPGIITASVKPWEKLSPAQKQALEVIADKIARILSGDPNYADNWHDIQGYARLVEERLPGRAVKPMPADFGQKNMLDPAVMSSMQAFAQNAPREVQGADLSFTDNADRQAKIEQSGELAEEVYLAVDASPAPYMPGEEEYGGHNTHCCRDHGCKYSDPRCPVAYGDAPGIPCEECAR